MTTQAAKWLTLVCVVLLAATASGQRRQHLVRGPVRHAVAPTRARAIPGFKLQSRRAPVLKGQHQPFKREETNRPKLGRPRSQRSTATRQDGAGQLERLHGYLTSAPAEHLAGDQRDLLRSSKINEILHAARSGRLTDGDVATFAQSVHPRLLTVFEQGAGLPQGYFLSVTRSVQFPGGNPFRADRAPSPAEQRRYRKEIEASLMSTVQLHRQRGGRTMPMAVQLLTSTSHLVAPGKRTGDRQTVHQAVQSIPLMELQQRHAYITRLSPTAVLDQTASRRALAGRKGQLVNFDHLLGALGKQKNGKLLIEIYAENMPGKRIDRYLPVTALGEGSYCVDDIARTTVALLQTGRPEMAKKARAGLAFVQMMQAPDGEFYNFATVKRGKLEVNRNGATSKKGIDFWAARALWAMGEGFATLKQTDPAQARALSRSLRRTLPHLEAPLGSYGRYRTVGGKRLPAWLLNDAADQTCVAMKGLLAFHRGLGPGKLRDRVASVIARYADGVARAQVTDPTARDFGRFLHSTRDPGATHLWGSRQVEVLGEAAQALGAKRGSKWIKAAKRCADSYWGRARPESITVPGEEQIAYGMETVVSGYSRLFGLTGEKRYADQTYRWASWFFGNNKARAMVYDPVSGRGYDGIRPIKDGRRTHYSVNSNAGAESTVESILAIQSAGRVPGVHRQLEQLLQRVLPR